MFWKSLFREPPHKCGSKHLAFATSHFSYVTLSFTLLTIWKSWLSARLFPSPGDALFRTHHLNSVPRPEHDLERGSASRAALSAPQLLFERHQARMARPTLQQHSIRNESFVRASVTARHHQVEDAQILKPESVARGHDRACHFPSRDTYRTKDEHVKE